MDKVIGQNRGFVVGSAALWQWFSFSIFLIFSLLIPGCGSGGGGGVPGDTTPRLVSAVIGTAGGEITSGDGKMKLTIPVGALGSTETISIEKIDPATLPTSLASSPLAYEMKPNGLKFTQPVSVSVIAPDAPLQKDGTLKAPLGSLLILSGSNSTIEAPANQEITVDGDTNSTTLTSTLTHFSVVVVRIENVPESQSLLDKLLTTALLGIGRSRTDLELFPLPPIMEIGKEEEARLKVFSFLESASTGLFRYKDQSQFPLIHFPEELRLMPDGFYSLIPSKFPSQVEQPLTPFGRYSCKRSSDSVEFKLTIVRRSATVESTVESTLSTEGFIPVKDQQITFKSKHKCQLPPPPPSATLTVIKDGTGTGKVVSGPGSINCGLNCTDVYPVGTRVVLAAGADEGSFFRGWAGGECTGISTCTVTVDKDKTVTAIFDKIPPSSDGSGSLVTVSPASLSNVHTVGTSPCPQLVGTFRVANAENPGQGLFGSTTSFPTSSNPRFSVVRRIGGGLSIAGFDDYDLFFDCEEFPPQTGKVTFSVTLGSKTEAKSLPINLSNP